MADQRPYPIPADEAERLRSLDDFGVLGAPALPDLPAVVELAAYICGVPVLRRVPSDRQRRPRPRHAVRLRPRGARAVASTAGRVEKAGAYGDGGTRAAPARPAPARRRRPAPAPDPRTGPLERRAAALRRPG